MDHLQKTVEQVRRYLFLLIIFENATLIGGWWLFDEYLEIPDLISLGILASLAGIMAILYALAGARAVLQPTTAIWQTVLSISPGFHDVIPPKINSVTIGRDLVSTLTAQIQSLIAQAEHTDDTASHGAKTQADTVLRELPIPIIVLGKTRDIVYANEAAARYRGAKAEDILGKNFYSEFNLSFSGDTTLDAWLANVGDTKALADTSWERVRLDAGEIVHQFDLAAHYSKDNPSGAEVTLALFDHTETYSEDDRGVDFVALSVHELRTPLTLLRGYIEVFEDELDGKLTPELQGFMDKMNVSAQQLTAFVSNILNVTRVDNDQLVLALEEEDWGTVLTNAVENLRMRARVRGIELNCEVAAGLPTVGVDSVSIFEVMNNLVDNAIKYSNGNNRIDIRAQLTKDGLVETTIQDWGIGIPESGMTNLFSKYYRNYRNRAQIGGTGLGLYLCKAIVAAHGGNIWVRSQEGQGATFGFTLLPYAKLADEQKNGNNKEIIRGAHGWIKNHSMYRR